MQLITMQYLLFICGKSPRTENTLGTLSVNKLNKQCQNTPCTICKSTDALRPLLYVVRPSSLELM